LVEHVLDGPVQSLSARRLWQYTQGNVLYLRHAVESESTLAGLPAMGLLGAQVGSRCMNVGRGPAALLDDLNRQRHAGQGQIVDCVLAMTLPRRAGLREYG
jgi:hypothetical protein